jgi:hypothetical protein
VGLLIGSQIGCIDVPVDIRVPEQPEQLGEVIVAFDAIAIAVEAATCCRPARRLPWTY